MESAEAWKLKNDSVHSNADIRKAISVYLKHRQVRDAAEAWLTLENYYAFFHGPGYGPRIAYYKQALMLFNQAGIKDRAAATLGIIGNFYIASAKEWKQKNDSVKSNAFLRRGIAVYLKNGQLREAAEAWLTMENYFAFFQGKGYGPRISYYEQALKLFNRAGIKNRAADTRRILGGFYQIEGNSLKALSEYKESLSLYQATGKKDVQDIYAFIGVEYKRMGNYDEALKYGLKALKTAESLGDTTMKIAHVMNYLAITYFSIKNYKQSLYFFYRSLQYAKKNKEQSSIILMTYNLADVLITLNRPTESFKLIKDTEKAYRTVDVVSRMLLNVSSLNSMRTSKKYPAAKIYSDTLLRLEPQIDINNRYRPILLLYLTIYFMEIKDYVKAQVYATKYVGFAERRKNNDILIRALQLQYKLDSLQQNYKGELRNFKRYIKLRDQLFDETKTKQIAQLEIQYQTEKKDQEIKSKETNIIILKKQAQLQAINIEQKETTQRLTIAGAILLTLLLGLSYNRYLLKQRVNRQLQIQQAEINLKNKSLTDLISEKDNLLEEKEWLMKEIHHRVKNNLQIVISLLNTQSSFLSDDLAYKAIRESQHRMQSISLIHQKLYQSENLSLINMQAYISDLVQYLSGSFDIAGRIRFEMDIESIELDVTKSVPLGLILNEAITNSIKYAFPEGRSGEIIITLLKRVGGHYQLSIRDNGVGLNKNTDITNNKTLGMSLMRGLSKQLSGTFKIKNAGGITITVSFVDETGRKN